MPSIHNPLNLLNPHSKLKPGPSSAGSSLPSTEELIPPSVSTAPPPPSSGYTFTHHHLPSHPYRTGGNSDENLPPRYLGYHLTPSLTPYNITFHYPTSPTSPSDDHDGPEKADARGVQVKGKNLVDFQEDLDKVEGVDGWVKKWVKRSLGRAGVDGQGGLGVEARREEGVGMGYKVRVERLRGERR